MKKAVSLLSLTTPNSNRKRRRLKDTLAQLTKETEISPFPPRKRPSAEHSLSIGSLLDISNTPETIGKALAGIDGRMDDSLFYATLKQLCHIYILLNINGSVCFSHRSCALVEFFFLQMKTVHNSSYFQKTE